MERVVYFFLLLGLSTPALSPTWLSVLCLYGRSVSLTTAAAATSLNGDWQRKGALVCSFTFMGCDSNFCEM